MLTLKEAQAALLAGIVPAQAVEAVPLAQAAGRFVARALRAAVDNPAFDNSAMDGYALAVADLATQGFALPLAGEAGCGDAPAALAPGTAMRIFTGAPLPAGADAVVIQEDVKLHDGKVTIPRSVQPGQNIRRRAEDFGVGEILYEPGRRFTYYDIALLGAAGIAKVPVYARPRALVVATGNELVAPPTLLEPGQIYESNRLPTILQLQDLGAEVVDGGVARDDPAALRALLERSGDYDFVVTSGGASVGERDLVKQIFAEIGKIDFWKVKIKPGKPVAFGRVGDRTHFFALPGNPVSSLVTFKLFVEPALYAWHRSSWTLPEFPAIAANEFRRHAGRMEFLRARLYPEHGRFMARALKGQGSHMLGPLRETNGFIKLDEDSTGFEEGATVTAVPLRLDIGA